MCDMRINLGGMVMRNPVMPASGAYGYFEHNAGVFPMSKLGAVMVKSVHRHPREGNPPPRITEVLGGMINAVGIPSVGIERFMAEELPRFDGIGAPVVLSLSGHAPEHYFESAEIVNDDARIGAIELNLSCPNVGTGLPFSSHGAIVEEIVTGVRSRTKLPLYVKLSPNVADIRETARAAEASGADAVTVANTYRAMKIDLKTGKPVLGNISGGMSGPAIKPQTLFLVYQASTAVEIPVIGCGGIATWQDAAEYIMAGAAAVQVGCANFANPMAMAEVVDGLEQFLTDRGCSCVEDLRGIAHGAN